MALSRVLEPEVMSGAEEATEYDSMDFSATDQLFAERAWELARGSKKIDWIIDLGSGNAKIPLAMCALISGGLSSGTTRVAAVEMSAEMLMVAAANRTRAHVSSQHLQLVSADVKLLPFAKGSVAMITSNSVVHHIPEPAAFFHEIARVARRDAPILVRDLVRPETERELEALVKTHAAAWSPLQRTLFSDSLRAALTVEEVRRALVEAGLASESGSEQDVRVTQITDRHWSAERR